MDSNEGLSIRNKMFEGEQEERKGFSCVEERGILEEIKKKREKFEALLQILI